MNAIILKGRKTREELKTVQREKKSELEGVIKEKEFSTKTNREEDKDIEEARV